MDIEEMTRDDCFAMLARTRLGRLGCARDNQPYVVPAYFAFHEPYLYGFTTAGQKVEWMRTNPLVCIEVDAVTDGDRWTSVVVLGRYEELPNRSEGETESPRQRQPRGRPAGTTEVDLSEQGGDRSYAHRLLQQYSAWWEAGCASQGLRDRRVPPTPVFYRILIEQISGRRASPGTA